VISYEQDPALASANLGVPIRLRSLTESWRIG
jgi:hypothetical protein